MDGLTVSRSVSLGNRWTKTSNSCVKPHVVRYSKNEQVVYVVLWRRQAAWHQNRAYIATTSYPFPRYNMPKKSVLQHQHLNCVLGEWSLPSR